MGRSCMDRADAALFPHNEDENDQHNHRGATVRLSSIRFGCNWMQRTAPLLKDQHPKTHTTPPTHGLASKNVCFAFDEAHARGLAPS